MSPSENSNDWRIKLNKDIPCPCKVEIHGRTLTPIAKKGTADWQADLACRARFLPFCWHYHPGAFGCLRSKETTAGGARQQCCYSRLGILLPPGHQGAGTPDKSVTQHYMVDVMPWRWCCLLCPWKCRLYKEKRAGDNSHCKCNHHSTTPSPPPSLPAPLYFF